MGKQALVQLLLRKKINSARTALETFLSESTIETREAELTEALSQAEQPEDIAAVEE